MYISVWKRWDFQRAACICLFISILRKATSGWCGTCGGDSKWMMYEGRMMQWCFNFVPELPEVTEHSSFKSPPWSQSHSSVSWNSVNCWFWDPRHWKPPPQKKNTGIPLDPSKIPAMVFPHIWKHPRNKWSVWSRWSLGFWNSQFFQFMIWIMLKVPCTYTPFSKNLVSTLVAFEQLFLLLHSSTQSKTTNNSNGVFFSHHLRRLRRKKGGTYGKFPRPHNPRYQTPGDLFCPQQRKKCCRGGTIVKKTSRCRWCFENPW